MQDVQNIPNPDVNIIEDGGDFGSHSDRDAPDTDVEQPAKKDQPNEGEEPRAPMVEPPEEDGEAPSDRNIIGLN